MLSKKLYLLFGTGAIIMILIVAVILPREQDWMSVFIIPFIFLGTLSYVFSPQLNWWWYQKHPPELPGNLGNLLLKYFPFYQNLSAENKTRFRRRTSMYLEARGFKAMAGGEERDVPLDLKLIIAANSIMITFGSKDFILDKFERIFVYLQAFPTPDRPYLHASELNEEDTCFLFSAEHIVLAFQQPDKFYNLVLHEFARAFQMTFPKKNYPELKDATWEYWKKDNISKFLAIPEDEITQLGVSFNFFFQNPQKFKSLMPDDFERYKQVFNIDPLNAKDPVIDKSAIANVP